MSRLSAFWRGLRLRRRFTRFQHSDRYQNTTSFIKRRPFAAFFITLGLLLLVMTLGSVISNINKKEIKKITPTKNVQVYNIGKAPTVTLQAQIDSQGIVQIVAQAPGIVQTVHAEEGDEVGQGQQIVSLSTNYQGGNAPALQAQLANTQLKNVNDTYSLQKDIIFQQRNIATASAENTEQLRRISEQSLGETRDLVSLNEDLLENLVDQIEQLEAINPADPTIQTLRGQQSQLQAGVNQLRGAVRNIEYSTSQQNPPTTLANAQREIALKQLDVQEKALDLNREVSKIQYNLALVQEGTMHPASPFKGVVQRIHVKQGQAVNPGDVIATISCTDVNSTAILRAPRDIAQSVSRIEPSTFRIGRETVSVTPTYVSTVATDGQLYSLIYNLPESASSSLTDQQYVTVDVPIGYANTNSVIPFIPIDAVYESQNESTVYLVEKNKATARKVEVGQVYGEFVEIISGLKNGDKIILNRNVIAGDKVKIVE